MARQARILLVDDRAENLVALEAILAPLNQVLVPVRSGPGALEALSGGEFAVILLDVVMPGMDGFQTAAQIKSHPRGRDVPIIFLTAAIGQPEQAARGYAAGGADYLAKPFDPRVLQAKVSVYVDLYLTSRQVREQAELIGGRPLLEELSARLSAVEESAAELGRLPAVAGDAAATGTAAELDRRVGRLRDALDALGAA